MWGMINLFKFGGQFLFLLALGKVVMKNFGKYLTVVIIFWFIFGWCSGGVSSYGMEYIFKSEQRRMIREVKPGKEMPPPGEKVIVGGKPVEVKLGAVTSIDPCQVAEGQAVIDQRPEGVVVGEDKLFDVQMVIADTDIKMWLIAGGVVLLVIIGVAVLSTRKVTIY